MQKKCVPIYETILKKIGEHPTETNQINSARDACAFVRALLMEKTREEFIVVMLDPQCGVMGIEVVHRGTPCGCDIFIPNVLTPAILSNSNKILVAHNHPTGQATEITSADIETTGRLFKACKIFGIDFVDHIVVDSNGDAVSISEVLSGKDSAVSTTC